MLEQKVPFEVKEYLLREQMIDHISTLSSAIAYQLFSSFL